MELTMPPRMLVQSEGRFQERGKLTMVKAQAYLKAGKTKKSVTLDDFWKGAGSCRRHAALRGEPKRHMGISIWRTRPGGFSCR
jgi:hypothetical protein